MSFNVAFAPRLPGNIPRIAYPIQHGADWISPFTATPADENDPGYKKITVRDEAGVLQERLFKIIDTTHYQDPILFEDWPTDPLDPNEGIAILSCCNNAFKINAMQTYFFPITISSKKCPLCRATGFTNASTILDGRVVFSPLLEIPASLEYRVVFTQRSTLILPNLLFL